MALDFNKRFISFKETHEVNSSLIEVIGNSIISSQNDPQQVISMLILIKEIVENNPEKYYVKDYAKLNAYLSQKLQKIKLDLGITTNSSVI